jgi:NADPH-dependent 2,4-dienoyl-CoA reductase/sulfur reductase-like enzyme
MQCDRLFDVLVIGAGPAGIAAACCAADHGSHVGIVDDNPASGGQIWRGSPSRMETRRAAKWRQRLAAAGIDILNSARVVAQPATGTLLVDTDDGPRELAYHKLILAVGARERFLPFPGWTLPNVIGAGGAQSLMKSGFPVNGKRFVVAGSGPLLLAVAATLREHGAEVRLIAEQAPWRRLLRFGLALPLLSPSKLVQGLQYQTQLFGVPYRAGCWPVAAEGDGRLERVMFSNGKRHWTESCDYLACGFGFVPSLELPRLLGCQLSDGAVQVNLWQETSISGAYCAGETTGVGGVDLALIEGQIAGLAAAGRADAARRWFPARRRAQRFVRAMDRTFSLRDELRKLATPETILCRCEDVPVASLTPYNSWRAAKQQTRCGMGACQGRICGTAAEFLLGWQYESTRPPIFPTSLGNLGGNGTITATSFVNKPDELGRRTS